jgi:alpha-ketoglutarate-dependent taurine dioxygenase
MSFSRPPPPHSKSSPGLSTAATPCGVLATHAFLFFLIVSSLTTPLKALYSSLSRGFQIYLEGLTALHSAVAQADGSRAAGLTVRREPIETVHPVVRVHPVTGWKSIYVNPGFTRRIVGVPKSESDAILKFLFAQLAKNPDFQVRFKWEPNSIAFWDNRVVTHSATFDFWPQTYVTCAHPTRSPGR